MSLMLGDEDKVMAVAHLVPIPELTTVFVRGLMPVRL
jgi:hypothetical protein